MHDLDRTLLEADPTTAGYTRETGSGAGLLTETQEMELASQLLGAESEQELDGFLADALRTVARALGSPAPPTAGKAVAGLLKSSLRRALPAAGQAAGGAGIGAQLAGQAGQLLGLELEGLSAEDREFEASRQLVRLVSTAAEHASLAPPGAEPSAVARQAVTAAARHYAPGLLRRSAGHPGQAGPASGRWVRQGQTITLYGC